jgi:methyl-accepting chemotaxis protein/methyl-accepting chemotaxis protein-1 (serine sensor receptor)
LTCAVILILAVAVGISGIIGSRQIASKLSLLGTQALPGVIELARTRGGVLEIRGTSLVIAMPAVSPAYREKQLGRIAELERDIRDRLRRYGQTAVSAEERPMYEKTLESINIFLETCSKYRALALDGKAQEAAEMWAHETPALLQAVLKSMADEIEFNQKNATLFVNDGTAASSRTAILTAVLLLLAVGGGSILGYLIVKNIAAALRDSADALRAGAQQVTLAAGELASTSSTLAQGASEQAASLEETSASGQEVSAMNQRTSEHARSAAGLMGTVAEQLNQANNKLDAMLTSMTKINSSSEQIAKVIKVIDEIAFQTNILALNAAVEAARAGEAGQGFAVVASEVRALAQRCAEAARETSQLISESVSSATDGNARLGEMSASIRLITKSAAETKALIDQVDQGSQEQTRGIEQISGALSLMESTTQQTAASAEESASASQELKAQADAMQDVLTKLEQLAGRV